MKYLISFLMLISSSTSWGLDQSDVDLIDQYKIVSSKVRMHSDEWAVDAKKMDKDEFEYGEEEFKDLKDWKLIKADEWFDLQLWITKRENKDKKSNWRGSLRNNLNSEIVGRVIKCIGVCRYYHSTRGISANFQTVLREGDEFTTEKNSYAWIALVDGTLLRVSPKTSLSLMEVNISKPTTFYLMRLNYGHIVSQYREQGRFETINQAETDLAFYPLMLREANREYYSIKEYRGFDDLERSLYGVSEHPGYILQYEALNKKIAKSFEKVPPINSFIFIYTPNVSLQVMNQNINMFYSTRGESHFKISHDIPNFEPRGSMMKLIFASLRGYNNKEAEAVESGQWYRVNELGSELTEAKELQDQYQITEAFMERIPTIQIAREVFFQKFSKILYQGDMTKDNLLKFHRYRMWDMKSEINKRIDFLSEYIRRTETTNIKTMNKLLQLKPEDRFDISFYATAMRRHYDKLKTMYSEKYLAVRELNDNEYYLWLLKNAKK